MPFHTIFSLLFPRHNRHRLKLTQKLLLTQLPHNQIRTRRPMPLQPRARLLREDPRRRFRIVLDHEVCQPREMVDRPVHGLKADGEFGENEIDLL